MPYKDHPELPYVRGSDTSEAAAESMASSADTVRRKVQAYIARCGEHGATCDQVEQMLGLTHQTASARVNELSKKGKIRDSVARRQTRSGRDAIVWVSSDEPRSELELTTPKTPTKVQMRQAVEDLRALYRARPDLFSPALMAVGRWLAHKAGWSR